MSTNRQHVVRPDDAMTLLHKLARARNREIEAGRQPVAYEVDAEIDALFAAAWGHYSHPYPSGKRLLGLEVRVSDAEGWRVVCRDSEGPPA